jgi:hypothetical protein
MSNLNNIDFFKKNRYCIIKNVLGKEILDIITQYALFDEMQNYTADNIQVIGAHSKYADPAMESLLLHLQPIVEKNTGLTLYPTYSYYRIYRSGDELTAHSDRESCEISATLCFNYNFKSYDFIWPIYMGNKRVNQNSGDMVIYAGCDLEHRREKLEIYDEEIWQVQGFFHYVDSNGPYADYRFDRRESIGVCNRKKADLRRSTKNYIEFT